MLYSVRRVGWGVLQGNGDRDRVSLSSGSFWFHCQGIEYLTLLSSQPLKSYFIGCVEPRSPESGLKDNTKKPICLLGPSALRVQAPPTQPIPALNSPKRLAKASLGHLGSGT